MLIKQESQILQIFEKEGSVAAPGRTVLQFNVQMPETPGQYSMVAEHSFGGGDPVQSLQDFKVK